MLSDNIDQRDFLIKERKKKSGLRSFSFAFDNLNVLNFLGIPIEGKGLPFCFKINCSIRWILNICNKDSVDSNNCRYICSIKFKHVISDILLNLSTALTLVNELKAQCNLKLASDRSSE